MYKTLKRAGQTCDAIPQEHPQLQTWKAMTSTGEREKGTVQDVSVHTRNYNNKRNIL